MRIGLILVLSALAACAHTGRRPASLIDPFTRQCERAIGTFVNNSSLDDEDRRQINLLNAAMHLAEFDLANHVRKAVAQKTKSCDNEKAVTDLMTELSSRSDSIYSNYSSLEVYTERVKALKAMVSLTDPAFTRKATCVALCESGEAECARRCGVSAQFVEETANTDGIISVVSNCVDFEDSANVQKAQVFEQLFNNYRPTLLKRIETGAKEAPALLARMGKVQSVLSDLLPKLQEVKTAAKAENCQAPTAPRWLSETRNSIVLVQDDRSIGTGFYLSGPKGDLRLVTAEHVFSADSEKLERDPRLFQVSGGKGRSASDTNVTFTVTPGLFTRGNDIIQTQASGNFKPLEIISEANVPMKGQRFHVAGFPGGNRDDFQMYDCTFVGFGRAFSRQSMEAAYILSCPTVPGALEGMSGGPLVDDFGRVWGVISAYAEIIGRVYVSPMSRDKDNRINMGIDRIFLSENCLRDNQLGYQKCQLMPNAYSLVP